MSCDYYTRDGWLELQLQFWKARMDIESHHHREKPRGYEICRDSHSCWIRRTTYGDDIKRGYYREDSEPDTEG